MPPPTPKPPRCVCPMHDLVYLVLETVDMLVGEAEKKKVDDWLELTDQQRSNSGIEGLRAAILAGALAHYHHDANTSPEVAFENFRLFWNKASMRVKMWEENPEQFKDELIDRRLEDYRS